MSRTNQTDERKELTELQAVVFDWAGTTVDYGCQGPVRPFVQAFADLGITVGMAEAREPMGMGKREHVAAMCAMPRIAEAWRVAYGREVTEDAIDALYQRVESGMVTSIHQYSMPIPGTVNAVRKMRELGLRIGSCTGYPRSVAEPLAAKAGELGYSPDVLVCASDVATGRPAPDMCNEVLARLGVNDPAKAVKIGDTVNDVLEGLRAGMWVIGLTLCGNLSGLTLEETEALPEEEKQALHESISQILLQAGAHFTAPDVSACIPLLFAIEERYL